MVHLFVNLLNSKFICIFKSQCNIVSIDIKDALKRNTLLLKQKKKFLTGHEIITMNGLLNFQICSKDDMVTKYMHPL